MCIIIIYYLYILIGLTYYTWSGKSFDDEYNLPMIHIDPIKIEKTPENILGPAKNILSNQLIINKYICGHSIDSKIIIQLHSLILIKSTIENLNKDSLLK
jgi:hypothetical protein